MTSIHPPGIWTVQVDWTSSRPVVPDEHTSFVTVFAQDETEATLLAAQIVACIGDVDGRGGTLPSGRPGCVMPTRTTILHAVF